MSDEDFWWLAPWRDILELSIVGPEHIGHIAQTTDNSARPHCPVPLDHVENAKRALRALVGANCSATDSEVDALAKHCTFYTPSRTVDEFFESDDNYDGPSDCLREWVAVLVCADPTRKTISFVFAEGPGLKRG